MKTSFDQRLVLAISLAILVISGGCLFGSSKNITAGNIAGEKPGLGVPVNQEPSPFDRRKELYRVYSAILNHGWDKGNIVVRDHTDRGMFQNDDWLNTNVGKSFADAVSDFKTANEKDQQLENRFEYNGKLSLIGQDEFTKTVNGADGWDEFKQRHQGASGIVTMSAVGFSRDGSHAIVNISYVCYSHCGNGSLDILEKKNEEWTLAQEISTWIS